MKELRPYQTIAVERALAQPLLIADACGLGKTIEAIEAIKLLRKQIAKPVLIVVPSGNVKLQWFNELQAQGIDAAHIVWLDSNSKIPELDSQSVVLTHYEALRKHVKSLARFYYSVIVADEAHRIKNRKALRTTAIKSLKAYRRIALTGTPYDKNPADVWSILNWLDPDFFSSYWRFFNAHISYHEQRVAGGAVVKVVNSSPLQDAQGFARVLRPYMIQRKKEDVRADLPPRIEQYIDLEMSPKQASAYRKIEHADDPYVELAEGIETSVQIILTQILRRIQITTDPALLGLPGGSSVKLDWVMEWLEDNPNESVIIFTRFRETALLLKSQLGDKFKLIVGGNRAAITSDDRYIVGTISAMGEGLDLPHIDHAIFIDVEWSSILMQQAIDRIHRINITNAKNIYYLRCVGTVDELVHNAIRLKWSTKELAERYLNGRKGGDDLI